MVTFKICIYLLLAIPAISETSGVNCMQNFTLKLVAIQLICFFFKQNDGFIEIKLIIE
jgi:hypothetical protein